jgi:hypothetical protein
MSTHASLAFICLNGISLNTPAVLGAVCAAALACQLRVMKLERCGLSPASVPALAHLIRDGSLTSICIDNDGKQLLDEPGAVQLADAIATNRQLLRLQLRETKLWRDAAAAATVFHALTGHVSLCDVDVGINKPKDHAAAGAALGALVAANAPALHTLHVSCSIFGDTGLGPLADALPRNTYLRHLSCYNTGMSEAFARERFLPAVQANTSLCELEASTDWNNKKHGKAPPEVMQAEALVQAGSGDEEEP